MVADRLAPRDDRRRERPRAAGGPAHNTTLVAAGAPPIGRDLDGRFTLGAELGRGGMGVVYRATQHSVGRPVAIKVVHPGLVDDERLLRRFAREARLSGQMCHPNAASVIDFGRTQGGLTYLVMELIDGVAIDAVLDDLGRLAVPRAVRIAQQICDALIRADELSIVHRDLKPANVMLLREPAGRDFVKVLDFGIARSELPTDVDADLTQTGEVLGTPAYLAPEAALGEELSGRADLYSLGVMIHEMVTGALPFEVRSLADLLRLQARPAAPPPLAGAPALLARLVAALLAPDPARRPDGALEVRAALDRIAADLAVGAAPAPSPASTATAPTAASSIDATTATAPTAASSIDATTATAPAAASSIDATTATTPAAGPFDSAPLPPLARSRSTAVPAPPLGSPATAPPAPTPGSPATAPPAPTPGSPATAPPAPIPGSPATAPPAPAPGSRATAPPAPAPGSRATAPPASLARTRSTTAPPAPARGSRATAAPASRARTRSTTAPPASVARSRSTTAKSTRALFIPTHARWPLLALAGAACALALLVADAADRPGATRPAEVTAIPAPAAAGRAEPPPRSTADAPTTQQRAAATRPHAGAPAPPTLDPPPAVLPLAPPGADGARAKPSAADVVAAPAVAAPRARSRARSRRHRPPRSRSSAMPPF